MVHCLSTIVLHLLLGTQFAGIQAEELVRLGGVLARDIVESSRGDVVSLALTHQAVVLEEVLLLGVVDGGLVLEDSLRLTPERVLVAVYENGKKPKETYSEIFSNSIV